MFKVRLADLNICIDNKYNRVEEICRDYLTDDENIDFSVSLTDEEILAEDTEGKSEPGYLECLAVYRKISEKLIEYNGFLMHGVIGEVKKTGIAFLARSGVGKTTHAAIWKKLLGDELTIVNGDKPLVRVIDGKVFAYGTPWAGKENIHKNMKTVLKKICFLERSEQNSCEELDKSQVFPMLINYIYKPDSTEKFLKTIEISGAVIEFADFYVTHCNMELEAAKIPYEKLINSQEK